MLLSTIVQLAAITGGIGSGKSTFARMLEERGAYRLDADVLTRNVQQQGTKAFEQIVDRWGTEILSANGQIDRKALGQIVFSSPGELEKLESYVHPAVRRQFHQEIEQRHQTEGVVLFELPLLQEGDSYLDIVAGVILVSSPIADVIERLQKFRGLTKEQAENRINNQIEDIQRRALADFVVENTQSIDELQIQVEPCWQWLQTLPTYEPREQ